MRRRRSRLKQSVHGWAPTADFAGGVVVFQQSSPLPPMGRLFSPRWLFRCSVRWLHSSLSRLSWPPARLLAAPPMSPGLRPRPGTGWRRRCGWRTRAAPVRRRTKQAACGARRAGGRSRPRTLPAVRARSNGYFFYYRRGPVSCQRMTHVSCFEDMI